MKVCQYVHSFKKLLSNEKIPRSWINFMKVEYSNLIRNEIQSEIIGGLKLTYVYGDVVI